MKEQDLNNAWNEGTNGSDFIDFDSFLRLNVKIDLLLDKIEDEADSANTTNDSGTVA